MSSKSIQAVTSLDLPALHPYHTLRRQEEHKAQGIFVAEGVKVVQRLLSSRLPLRSILLTQTWLDRLLPDLPEEGSYTIYVAEQKLLEAIVGFRMHQGIMAVGSVPPDPTLEEIAAQTPQLLVALDGLTQSENVGVVVRNCAAFGVTGVLVGKNACSPYLRRAVRNSMGTVFTVPVMHVADLHDILVTLQMEYRTHIVGAHAHAMQELHGYDLGENLCIVFGNEESGISPDLLDLCNVHLRIPMANDTDSLNVASASAVFLAEASRQHRC